MNNASILTGDRTTHRKIVVAALICSTVVAGIGIAGPHDRRTNLR
jgi:hypothetical protein